MIVKTKGVVGGRACLASTCWPVWYVLTLSKDEFIRAYFTTFYGLKLEETELLYDLCCEYRRLFPDEIARDYQENQGEEEE